MTKQKKQDHEMETKMMADLIIVNAKRSHIVNSAEKLIAMGWVKR